VFVLLFWGFWDVGGTKVPLPEGLSMCGILDFGFWILVAVIQAE